MKRNVAVKLDYTDYEEVKKLVRDYPSLTLSTIGAAAIHHYLETISGEEIRKLARKVEEEKVINKTRFMGVSPKLRELRSV